MGNLCSKHDSLDQMNLDEGKSGMRPTSIMENSF
jgi:hypothetical protein